MQLDIIYNKSSESMIEIPDSSVHFVVTSPPYRVNKEYEQNMPEQDYWNMLVAVFDECYRVLCPGGKLAVNIANTGRKPYVPLHAQLVANLDAMVPDLIIRGEIIWDKGVSVGTSTAWGSFGSPSNPVLRDVHEYILVFSKGDMKLESPNAVSGKIIDSMDFTELTQSIWRFPAEHAKHPMTKKPLDHPATFPIELPSRLIKLYSYPGDIVLDPFMGSGTTAVAAYRLGRQYIGYEKEAKYVAIADDRLQYEKARMV